MSIKPIPFSAPMIRALIDGRKTQTRRVLKNPTKGERIRPDMGGWTACTIGGEGVYLDPTYTIPAPERPCVWNQTTRTIIAPPHAPGDLLWVRETCRTFETDNEQARQAARLVRRTRTRQHHRKPQQERRGESVMKRAAALALAMLAMPHQVEATTIPHRAKDALSLVSAAARKHGVPVAFATAIAMQESGGLCSKNGRPIVGKDGEVGPLQIKPSTSRHIGLPVSRKSSCAAQVNAGMKHLAMCLRGARGDKWRAATCHNAGLGSLEWKRPPKAAQRYANEVLGRKTKPARIIEPAAAKPVRYVTNFNGGSQ